METAVTPPADADLQFLTNWEHPGGHTGVWLVAAVSILLHIAFIFCLAVVPIAWFRSSPAPQQLAETRIVIPLVQPPLTELTQKAPNTGKVNKEFDIPATNPGKRIPLPAGPPSPRPRQPFHPAPAPVAPVAKPVPVPEPPRIQASENKPNITVPLPQPALPEIQAVEKPKLAFENPGLPPAPQPGQAPVVIPRATAEDAIKGALRGGTGTVPPAGGAGGFSNTVNVPELLSDPMGADFRPYLARILASVKRSWFTIWPESARMGRSGRVALQFSIDRAGLVPKLVIASSSGVDALDRAAVAAISQSAPFPPFPREFRGSVIKLQLNFSYNLR